MTEPTYTRIPLPASLDITFALIAMLRAGNMCLEIKDAQGQTIEKRPVLHFQNLKDSKESVATIPMDLAHLIMKHDYEMEVVCLRPFGAIDNSKDVLTLVCRQVEAKKIITENHLTPNQISVLKNQLRQNRRNLN